MLGIEVIYPNKATEFAKKPTPRGKFMILDAYNHFEGVDNSTGKNYHKEFDNMEDCINWLLADEYI